MQAIRTKYKGILFRSKLEAEWAKFMDSMGMRWIYEPEGFKFSDGTKYLPDFWLPDSKQWFEVKRNHERMVSPMGYRYQGNRRQGGKQQ